MRSVVQLCWSVHRTRRPSRVCSKTRRRSSSTGHARVGLASVPPTSTITKVDRYSRRSAFLVRLDEACAPDLLCVDEARELLQLCRRLDECGGDASLLAF